MTMIIEPHKWEKKGSASIRFCRLESRDLGRNGSGDNYGRSVKVDNKQEQGVKTQCDAQWGRYALQCIRLSRFLFVFFCSLSLQWMKLVSSLPHNNIIYLLLCYFWHSFLIIKQLIPVVNVITSAHSDRVVTTVACSLIRPDVAHWHWVARCIRWSRS